MHSHPIRRHRAPSRFSEKQSWSVDREIIGQQARHLSTAFADRCDGSDTLSENFTLWDGYEATDAPTDCIKSFENPERPHILTVGELYTLTLKELEIHKDRMSDKVVNYLWVAN